MSKKDMILALVEHYTNGNKAQFATRLGITPQGLSTWLKRESFDNELIFSKCEDLNPEWLLTGNGPMLKQASEAPAASVAPAKDSLDASETTATATLVALLQAKDTQLMQQAEAIGRLKQRIEQLEEAQAKDASHAHASPIAHAG